MDLLKLHRESMGDLANLGGSGCNISEQILKKIKNLKNF